MKAAFNYFFAFLQCCTIACLIGTIISAAKDTLQKVALAERERNKAQNKKPLSRVRVPPMVRAP
jgi:hypothetical protein